MKFLARALPCVQRSLPGTRRLERVLNEFFPNVFLLRISRFCVAEKLQVVQLHLLPGTLLPAMETMRKEPLRHGKKTQMPKRIALDRSGLGGFAYGRVTKQATRPCRQGFNAYWLLSSCLIVCSSRSVRTPARPKRTPEVPQE